MRKPWLSGRASDIDPMLQSYKRSSDACGRIHKCMMLYLKTLREVISAIFPKFHISMNGFQAATYGARDASTISPRLAVTIFTENSIRCGYVMNDQSSCKERRISISKTYFAELDLSGGNSVVCLTLHAYFCTTCEFMGIAR